MKIIMIDNADYRYVYPTQVSNETIKSGSPNIGEFTDGWDVAWERNGKIYRAEVDSTDDFLEAIENSEMWVYDTEERTTTEISSKWKFKRSNNPSLHIGTLVSKVFARMESISIFPSSFYIHGTGDVPVTEVEMNMIQEIQSHEE